MLIEIVNIAPLFHSETVIHFDKAKEKYQGDFGLF
jgi:hypothetical protein